ncbi:quinone-dependent dihydroorotate dehydrogenase [Blastopirellula marina]|uniref:Dihydroorotate dehydrogenase (quinone) n=1 Tax=Blastopirellula marina DSM 3645 TaxID=314230 RepID=A3ZNL9_9BACT|nr:quinone-dependent dihydroorotate dehydrogenase [Blastopirellula marina]EAQ81914.1 dihydroorotate dehydrogenase [Blastopirellula marina DSM 3645]
MNLYRSILRPLLFHWDAETAHHATIAACRIAGAIPLAPQLMRAWYDFAASPLESNVAGLTFPNPVGLAAGWDKNGHALRLLDSWGFGFAEIGSISAAASLGNRRPRLFRLPQDRAIVVNYGLPNDGAEVIAQRLAKHRIRRPLGVNLVKTNQGPDAAASSAERIVDDYVCSAQAVHRHASYLTLNLSCPNAAGGKDFFAQPGSIRQLLTALLPLEIACPLFLKVAPNPDPAEIERLLEECEPFAAVRGFLFNLPVGKAASLALTTPRQVWEKMPGAVAGQPVAALSNRCIAEMYQRMPRDRYVIIGGGGVFSAADAYEKMGLGASLIQIYTALVYEGPGVVGRINRGLLQLLAADGFSHVGQAVGSGCRATL